jgi:hypothetical protein
MKCLTELMRVKVENLQLKFAKLFCKYNIILAEHTIASYTTILPVILQMNSVFLQ